MLRGRVTYAGSAAVFDSGGDRAATADGGDAQSWVQLAISLERQGRADEALAAFEAAWRSEQAGRGGADTFVNLAIALRERNRGNEALALLAQNLAHAPDAYGCFIYAMALLGAGRFDDGWAAYESRWITEHFVARRPNFRQPVWHGQDLRGKTILLRAEQGLGDTIQFVRYARLVRALGARVLLKVHDGFESFARCFADVDRVLDFGEAPAGFDYYAHLMSLPRVFATDLTNVPAHVPYVEVDRERAARWSERIGLGAGLRVGLVWAGGAAHQRDRERSIPLEALVPLSSVANVRWIGLQKGPRESDAGELGSGWEIDNLGAEFADFTDTAAAIDALDLVISVDTAVAHLAGALGKHVWLLLPTPADFRWLEGRADSPWYPTMQLFRQRVPGAWDEVIARAAAALADAASTGLPRTAVAAPALLAPQPKRTPAHCRGLSAVAETRYGIVQYLPDALGEGTCLGYYGEWLQLQLDWCARWLRPGATVLELGASVGAHALRTSREIGPQGRAILVETDPLRRRILRQNLAANRIENAVVPDVWTTVDEFRPDRLDVLKVSDARRAVECLAGAEQTLWAQRPVLFLSVADDNQLARIAEAVRGYGYRCGFRTTPLFNPANFNRREDDVTSGRSIITLVAIAEEVESERGFEGGTELI